MKLSIPYVDIILDTVADNVNELVVENQVILYKILSDLSNQMQGNEGLISLSIDNKQVSIAKRLEFHSQFVPFEINKKTINSKIVQAIVGDSLESENYERTQEIIANLTQYLEELTLRIEGDIRFEKIAIESILKGIGVSVYNEYDDLANQLSDYMDLVNAYEIEKMFVLVNLRSYLDDESMQALISCIKQRGHHVLLIEAFEREKLHFVTRTIVDKSLCVIQ